MIRRMLLTIGLLLVVLSTAAPAWAGSYLDRAALLLDQARKEGDMLQPRTHDKELVAVVKALAEVRAKTGRKMEVPAAIGKAHPHFLLVLENCERAAEAAQQGNFKKFMEHLTTARNEDRTFRTIISELGFTLPDLGGKR